MIVIKTGMFLRKEEYQHLVEDLAAQAERGVVVLPSGCELVASDLVPAGPNGEVIVIKKEAGK